jgi:glycosyltransferase involved in cell wall biosynthesis
VEAARETVAVVAARDEAGSIADTVRGLFEAGVDRVVVSDDGSVDATADLARSAGAQVVGSERPRGKGGALEAAFAGLGGRAGLVVLADADLGVTSAALAPLIDRVASGEADICIGVLPPQGGGLGTVKAFSRWCIRRLTGFDAREPLSGQRVMPREALEACRPLAHGFGVETAMTIDAVRLGFRLTEVEADLRHRAGGRDIAGFAHRGRQGWDILRAVAVRWVRLR